ncbi:hypothetical protein ACFFRR_004614, partial [Megaselia abdita]
MSTAHFVLLSVVSAFYCHEVCEDFTPHLLKIITCVNMNRSFLKIIMLTKNSSKSFIVERFINEMIESLDVPVLLKHYHNGFEFEVIDYSELFSWSGEEYYLRPGQKNQKVILNGTEFAHQDHDFKEIQSAGIILVSENLNIFDEYLSGSPRPPFQFPRMVFSFLILERSESNRILEILSKMWRSYGILTSVLVLTCDDHRVHYLNHFEMKSGRINATDELSWGIPETVLVNKNLSKICNRNPENYPKTLNKFPLRVLMFLDEPKSISWNRFPTSFLNSALGKLREYNPITTGVIGLSTAGLVEYLNFTPIYKSPDTPKEKYSFRAPNGSIMGAGKVAYSKYDLVGVMHFINTRLGMDYEFLKPIFFNKYCVIAPKAKKIPLYITIVRFFSPITWILFLVTPWYAIFILKVLDKMRFSNGNNSSSLYHEVLMFYHILFATSTIIRAHADRWILWSCMATGIVFTTIFNAKLYSYITTRPTFKDIDTLKVLSESKYNILTESPYMLKVLFDSGDNSKDHLYEKLQSKMRLDNESMQHIIQGKSCTVRQMLDFQIFANQISSEYGEEKIHLVEECPAAYHLSYLMRSNCPFAP